MIGYGRAQQIIQILDTDPEAKIPEVVSESLKEIKNKLGSVKCHEILQILWANFLHKRGDNLMGALNTSIK